MRPAKAKDMDPRDIVKHGYNKVSRAYRGDIYDHVKEPYYRRCLNSLLPHVVPRSRILDLGCGCGVPVAQELSAEHDVTGIDISPVQIERGRSLVPKASFLCEDMTKASFPAGAFDAIVSMYAIFHVPVEEQPRLFRSISTWLRPDGWLLCTVSARTEPSGGTEENWLDVPGATMYWSNAGQPTYETWLAEAGFRVDETLFIPEEDSGHTALLAHKRPVWLR